MPLTATQKRHLRQLAHALKPVVIIGHAGLSPALLAELDSSLERHELLKVRVNAEDREARRALTQALCEQTRSEWVQSIGHIAVIYRRAEKPRLSLPA